MAEPMGSAFEALPQVPVAKAVAHAAANGMTVKAVDASEVIFVVIAHPDGRVDLNSKLAPSELADALRALADALSTHPTGEASDE